MTGSTGFVGKRILQDLLENNYQVRCLARKGSEQKISHYKNPVLVKTGIDIVNGDITDAASLDGKLEGCDAVINLVGIIREFRGRGITFEKLHYEGNGKSCQGCTITEGYEVHTDERTWGTSRW